MNSHIRDWKKSGKTACGICSSGYVSSSSKINSSECCWSQPRDPKGETDTATAHRASESFIPFCNSV
jgi:hypothetical protein